MLTHCKLWCLVGHVHDGQLVTRMWHDGADSIHIKLLVYLLTNLFLLLLCRCMTRWQRSGMPRSWMVHDPAGCQVSGAHSSKATFRSTLRGLLLLRDCICSHRHDTGGVLLHCHAAASKRSVQLPAAADVVMASLMPKRGQDQKSQGDLHLSRFRNNTPRNAQPTRFCWPMLLAMGRSAI